MRLLRTHSILPLVMLLVGFALGVALMTALFGTHMMIMDTPIRQVVPNDCVCGLEVNHLRRLAKIALYHSQHKMNLVYHKPRELSHQLSLY